jgi:hypothetical protein
MKFLELSKTYLGESLMSIEYMDITSVNMVTKQLKVRNPFSSSSSSSLSSLSSFYCLVSCAGMNLQHNEEKMLNLLEHSSFNENKLKLFSDY